MVAHSNRRGPRRPAAESRQLVSAAARELFGLHGFTNTSVAEIAAKSGVAETVIYRLYGTKAQLFEDVIFGDVVDAIVGWLHEWARAPGTATTEESGHAYIGAVHDMVSTNRGQILALLAAEAFEPEFSGARPPLATLNRALKRVTALAREEFEFRGWHGVDAELVTRFTFALIFSTAMFPEIILPTGRARPSDQRLIEELTSYMLFGVTRRPDAPK